MKQKIVWENRFKSLVQHWNLLIKLEDIFDDISNSPMTRTFEDCTFYFIDMYLEDYFHIDSYPECMSDYLFEYILNAAKNGVETFSLTEFNNIIIKGDN